MDAFYASVELRRRPELRGKPVVVCGSGPRAVVTTASYEARRLAGIHSAMPAAVARRRLPDAIYLQPDFPAYREASGEVMAILRGNAETVEVVGLDEAYVDLTGLFSPKATMRRIATEIREQTGLSCSIGISENRMLAKITSELGKPAGLVVLSRGEALERFAADSPGSSPESGRRPSRSCSGWAFPTWPSCASTTWRRWRAPSGRGWAAGCRPGRVSKTRRRSRSSARPSRSRPRRPSTPTSPTGARWRMLLALAEELCRRLRSRDLAGRTIGIKVRLDDWTNVSRSHTVEAPTNDPEVVIPAALDLLRAYAPPRPVRLLGVRMAGFARPTSASSPRSRTRTRCGSSSALAGGLSGWRGPRRPPGSGAAPGSPSSGRSRARRRRGRGRRPGR